MKAPTKLAAYGVVLAVMAGGGAGLGAAAGPIDVSGDESHETHPATPVAAPSTTDLPAPSRRAEVDGYRVALDGDARPGESELAFTVTLDGEPVRTEPYLGAAGHLVAIRAGDLAYLHVHPLDGEADEVRFAAEFPSPGTYRLFLDFAHAGEVRTAAFTVEVPGDTPGPTPSPAAGDEHGSH